MRIKGTKEERELGKEFWVAMEPNGRYAIHSDITPEERGSFLVMDGPFTYDDAIVNMQESVNGEWDDD